MKSNSFSYEGQELALFARAKRWKAYLHDQLAPYLQGDVLEVGAGLGYTTAALYTPNSRPSCNSWLCLEPDPENAKYLASRFAGEAIEVLQGTLDSLAPSRRFDAILYIDVLEHIEHDDLELARAKERLLPGGRLLILAPAHQWLYSPLDRAIGHYRRYSASQLTRAIPPGLLQEKLVFLDSFGMLASLGSRFLLSSANPYPTPLQIRLWDGVMVPLSRRLDPLLRFRLGKSLLGIWRSN